MGDRYYFRGKVKTRCPNTERQQAHHQVTARGVAAWQSLTTDKQELWNRLGERIRPHSWPFNNGSSPVSVPDLALDLIGISESDSSTLNIECKATPAIPEGFCINARIKVHAYGCDCNPGYKLSCCGKSDDGCC